MDKLYIFPAIEYNYLNGTKVVIPSFTGTVMELAELQIKENTKMQEAGGGISTNLGLEKEVKNNSKQKKNN